MAVGDSYVPSSTCEMSIILEDVEVIFGLPIDDEVFVRPTAVVDENWRQLCLELLGFGVSENDYKTLMGQRILISRLVERIAKPLTNDATEIQIHQYAQCYIFALLGDKIFIDKSRNRVHLMFLEFLRNLRDPPQYSWVMVAWNTCTESCAEQVIKRHHRLVGHCN